MRRRLAAGLIVLGWFLFLASLPLPAMNEGRSVWPGWKCLCASLVFCLPFFWGAWQWAVLGVTNLLFLGSLLVSVWESGIERRAYGVCLFSFSVATLFILPVRSDDLLVGSYLWRVSLLAAALGMLLCDPPREGSHRGV